MPDCTPGLIYSRAYGVCVYVGSEFDDCGAKKGKKRKIAKSEDRIDENVIEIYRTFWKCRLSFERVIYADTILYDGIVLN